MTAIIAELTSLTVDQFLETYKPQVNPLRKNASWWNGTMLETFGPELELVKAMCATDINRVWTILECDGKEIVTNGFHYVNRQGYLITEIPAPAGATIEVVDPDDVHDEDDDEADAEG